MKFTAAAGRLRTKPKVKSKRGGLFIVSAPSGSGKTTLCKRLSSEMPNIRHSVSFTTRPPRSNETNDEDYTFIDADEFQKMAEADEFAEWARVHGHLYGTSKKRILAMISEGIDVILDIDTRGARKMRGFCDKLVYIFVLPPSMDVLRQRLENRRSNSQQDIDLRIKRAYEEIAECKSYDYVIINDEFDEALEYLKAIVRAEGVKTCNLNPEWIKENFNI